MTWWLYVIVPRDTALYDRFIFLILKGQYLIGCIHCHWYLLRFPYLRPTPYRYSDILDAHIFAEASIRYFIPTHYKDSLVFFSTNLPIEGRLTVIRTITRSILAESEPPVVQILQLSVDFIDLPLSRWNTGFIRSKSTLVEVKVLTTDD